MNMNRPVKKFSDCHFTVKAAMRQPFASTSPFAQIGEKLGLHLAKGTDKWPGPEKNWVCGLPHGQ
jgi:hypothetical protein